MVLLLSIACVTPAVAHSQKYQERTQKAYRELDSAIGADRVSILNRLTGYLLIDSTNRSDQLNRIAINLANETADSAGLADAWMNRARLFFMDPLGSDSSCEYLQKSQDLKYYLADSSELEIIYQYFGRLAYRKGDAALALAYYDTASVVATRNGNSLRLARIFNETADCHKSLGNHDRAMTFLERSLSVYRESADTADLGSYMLTLGISFNDMGQKERANEVYLMAARFSELAGDIRSLAYAYSNLSDLCHSHTYRGKGNDYAQLALELFRDIGDERGMAYALNNLGQFAFDEKDYNEALIYYLEAAHLKEISGDIQGACFVHCNLAELYAIIGNYPSAMEELEHAETLCNLMEDRLCETVVFHAYGKYYSIRKEYERARLFYQRSLLSAEKLSLHDFIIKNLAAISEQYQAEGRPEEALEFYKRYTTVRDSASRNINIINMAELLVRYEAEKKEDLLKDLMDSRQSRSYLFGIVSMALLLAIALSLIRMRLKRTGLQSSVERIARPVITSSRHEAIWIDLQRLMEEDRLYLNSRIKLSDLADHLNTNTTYLSMVINETTGDNFCNYLNTLRIRDARQMLLDPEYKNFTIEAIAQAVGFNSKSAFNSAFKKQLSVTPRQYLHKSRTP